MNKSIRRMRKKELDNFYGICVGALAQDIKLPEEIDFVYRGKIYYKKKREDKSDAKDENRS